jgi:membrane-associated phospholipid phosphatase
VEDGFCCGSQAWRRLTAHPAKWLIALGSAGAFIILAVCVHLGLTQTLDVALRDWARPHDVWGIVQLRADVVAEALSPAVLGALLAVFTVAYCVKRRSIRPALFVGAVCLVTVVMTIATKTVMGRPDPHGLFTNDHGGSFPSGHVVGVVICLGLALQMARPSADPWVWLSPILGGGVMGACLLLEGVHWATDIVGGGLLATGLLAIATAPTLGGTQKNEACRRTPQLDRQRLLRSCGGKGSDPTGDNADRRLWPGLRRCRDGRGSGFTRPRPLRCRCRPRKGPRHSVRAKPGSRTQP